MMRHSVESRDRIYVKVLKVHQCRYVNLPISLTSHKSNAPNEGFELINCLLFEIYTPEIPEMFVCKHRETIECVKK